MRILIYGAGAVGGYIGGHLAMAGHSVTLLGRQPLVDAVNSNGGLTLRQVSSAEQIVPLQAVVSLDEALSGENYDWIGFTMKAYDTVPAIHVLQQRLPQPPPIISFQNGVGNEESLGSAFGAEQVAAGTLTTAVTSPHPGIIQEERPRGISIAQDTPAGKKISTAFRETSLHFEPVAEGISLKWSKVILNMLGNATSAILDMPPGEVFGDWELFRIEWLAQREALAIMQLKDIQPVNLPGVSAKTLTILVRWLPPRLLQRILTQRVAKGRGDKLPSLQLAMRAQRTQTTEVAWLNGAVANAARQENRLAPVNHALALIVADITAGRVPWEVYRHKPEMLITSIRAVQGMDAS